MGECGLLHDECENGSESYSASAGGRGELPSCAALG
jgi:hypothetical protein